MTFMEVRVAVVGGEMTSMEARTSVVGGEMTFTEVVEGKRSTVSGDKHRLGLTSWRELDLGAPKAAEINGSLPMLSLS